MADTGETRPIGCKGEPPVDGTTFDDHYETLQVSPNADADTIDRVFRHLAKRYHPDNRETADRERFDRLVTAHRVLSDPEQRTRYDLHYEEGRALQWGLAREAASGQVIEDDRVVRERLLSLLYVQRRRDVTNPSIGNIELERLLSLPEVHLDFHIWFLKEKKLVERTERGFAITALGVEEAERARSNLTRERLLPEQAGVEHGPESAPLRRHLSAVTLKRGVGSES
jgi:curved DNA-binding protein CbpA